MGSEQLSGILRKQERPVELHELIEFLYRHGITQHETWGRCGIGSKSVIDLLREINEDGVTLHVLPDGRVARLAERVFIRAWFIQGGETYVIREICRIFRDGTPDWRTPPPEAKDAGFTETKNPLQTVYDVVLQGLRQELGIRFGRNSVRRRIQHLRLVPMGPGHASKAYAGLVTVDYGYVVSFRLRKRDIRQRYIERGPDGVVTLLMPVKEGSDDIVVAPLRKQVLPLVL